MWFKMQKRIKYLIWLNFFQFTALIISAIVFTLYTQKLTTFDETTDFSQINDNILNCYGICSIKLDGLKTPNGSSISRSILIGDTVIDIPNFNVTNYYDYVNRMYIDLSFQKINYNLRAEIAMADVVNNKLPTKFYEITPNTTTIFKIDKNTYNVIDYSNGYQLILNPIFTGSCPKCVILRNEYELNLVFRIIAYSVSVVGIIKIFTYLLKLQTEKESEAIIKRKNSLQNKSYRSNIEIVLPVIKHKKMGLNQTSDHKNDGLIPPVRDCIWDLTKSRTFYKSNGRLTTNINDMVAGTINGDNKSNLNTFIWEMNNGYTTAIWLYYDDYTCESIILSRGTPQPLTPVGPDDPPGYLIHIEIVNNFVISFY